MYLPSIILTVTYTRSTEASGQAGCVCVLSPANCVCECVCGVALCRIHPGLLVRGIFQWLITMMMMMMMVVDQNIYFVG
ncbi:hypothetical protein INR49_001087 [Caranx melampygus]|nr:hypothetical protein INR49_001087 [Caranx melampygus]